MTKKHFIKLAHVLAQNKSSIHEDSYDSLVSDIADFCEEENKNFNRKMFIIACYKR